MISKLNQKGFGAVEALLLLVVVGVVSGAGFYIYSASKSTNESVRNAGKSNIAVQPKDKSNGPVKTKEVTDKNPGYVTITEWDLAGRLGDKSNSDKITYRIDKDEYGDDTAYFLLKESVSTNCRDIGFALHRKNSATSKYTQIGNAYYAPSAAPMSMCDKSPSNEQAAVHLLNEISASLNKQDFEFKTSN